MIHDTEEAEGQVPTHARGTREWLSGAKGEGGGGYRALEQLRKEGKVMAFGAGINIAVGTPNHTWETYRKVPRASSPPSGGALHLRSPFQ